MMLNLNFVRTFVTVARTGSFRGAADELGLSPATVSHQIKQLETSLGATLVSRGPRCLATPAGERLLPHARAMIRLNERAVAAVSGGPMRLGASSNIGIYLLPPLMQRLNESSALALEPELTIDTNPAVVNQLDDGGIDLALVETAPENSTHFQAVNWRDEPMVVITPPDHSWANRSRIAAEELARTRLLAGEPGTGTGRLLHDFLAGYGITPSISAQLGSTEAVKRNVAHGRGISLVLRATVTGEVAAGDLAAIPVGEAGLSKPLWAAWRRDESVPGRSNLLAELDIAA